jgi:hypothetical protein
MELKGKNAWEAKIDISVPNPYNGIESLMMGACLKYENHAKNPYNGIERT